VCEREREREIEMSGGWWWKPVEEDDGGAAAASPPVLSGQYQALEMSTMVSALAHVVAGGDDDNPPAAMGGGVHAPRGRSHYPAASAPTADQFATAGERQARIIILVFFIR
jgi:hypothetical protein